LGLGHIRTRTHDYERHGTITLFAALSYLEGKILSRTEERHTHVQRLRFLKQIDRETPQIKHRRNLHAKLPTSYEVGLPLPELAREC